MLLVTLTSFVLLAHLFVLFACIVIEDGVVVFVSYGYCCDEECTITYLATADMTSSVCGFSDSLTPYFKKEMVIRCRVKGNLYNFASY